MKQFIRSIALAGVIIVWMGAKPQHKSNPRVNQIPFKVMEALKAKFPQPEVQMWTKSKEGKWFLYDIEFKQGGEQREARIRQDGTVQNWEKEIAIDKLPSAVKKAIDQKYANCTMDEIMQYMVVKNGKDELDRYLIVLATRGRKDIEVIVDPDGRILKSDDK